MNHLFVMMFITTCMGYRFHDLADQKSVLIETYPVHIFDESEYLYHIFNLSQLMEPVDVLNKSHTFSPNKEQTVLLIKVKAFMEQLNFHSRHRRSIEFLGTAMKWMYGIPDRTEMNVIETDINNIIQNNNKQKVINSYFEKFIANGVESETTLILREIVGELKNMIEVIENARNNLTITTGLNLNEISSVISNERTNVTIMNVLEYSKPFVMRMEDIIVLTIKYPKTVKTCQHFKIIPLEFRHGKLVMDKTIARCNRGLVRVKNCQSFMDSNICEINYERDRCTIPVTIKDDNIKCKVIQEENLPIQNPEYGYIIIDGINDVNNSSMNGIFC